MLQRTPRQKRYSSAKDRFVKPAFINFFKNEFSSLMGPLVREQVADQLMSIVEKLYPSTDHIQPGQMLWNALDKRTRADSPRRKYIPVILTLICESDIQQMENGACITDVNRQAIARILREAYQQGALLSMRDVGLILHMHDSYATTLRQKFEEQNRCMLPHTGNLHDMGTCITHKKEIVYKVVVQKKDPLLVSKETNHTQYAVDRYLKDYYRVRTIYTQNQDPTFIATVTNMSKNLVNQYIELINAYENLF
ncbi:MAG TPA: DUF1670 domain-containing protein [Bacteroidales bacterium]|nr:DUF1670 domain-containing protein [Bacteroidales bacterium]